MSDKTAATLTPKAQHPERTKKFVSAITDALEVFEDNIRSLDEDLRTSAYETFLILYKDVLTPFWSLTGSADIKMILKTVTDKELTSLKDMARKLEPQSLTAKVSQERRKIPDLEVITAMFKERCPSQNVPDTEVCKQISDVFFKLAEAHKAYGEAAEGIAELASHVTPEQYTMILVASAMPTIQVVVPGQMLAPLTTPQLHQAETSTAIARAELIKFTKSQVLPDPYSPELVEADKNSATRVLAAAVFLKIEKLYFDDTTSRMDASTLFGCKVSQLTKAITGVDYKSGPHHYVPKRQRETAASKHKAKPEPGPSPAKKQKEPSTSSHHTTPQWDDVISDPDTLPTGSSSSSDLPEGL